MKQLICVMIIAYFAIIFLPVNSIAQEDKNTLGYNSTPLVNAFSLFNDKNYFTETNANNVSRKAIKDFNKSFGNVTGEKWYSISGGFIANFNRDEIQTKVVYDLKGNWHCTLSAYNENHLPFDIKDLVKSRYYEFNILVAYEIKYDTSLIYIVKMENNTKIKTLKISNGEIEVIGDYVKG